MRRSDINELQTIIDERDSIIQDVLQMKAEALKQASLAETNDMLYEVSKMSSPLYNINEKIKEKLTCMGVFSEDVAPYINSKYGIFPEIEKIIYAEG